MTVDREIVVDRPFNVLGGSLTGLVVGISGGPVKDVVIKLNGKEIGITNN